MLKQRIITACALLLVLGGAVALASPAQFALLSALIVLLAGWEWGGLVVPGVRAVRALYVLVLGLLMAAWQWLLPDVPDLFRLREVLGIAGLFWALALLWVLAYPASARVWGYAPVLALMGGLVLLPCWLALVWLREAYGLGLLLYLAALVSTADIGAYFAGRAFGRRKLAPAVSPGKSWAGFWGGLLAVSLLAGLAVWQGWFASHTAWQLWLASMLAALASVLGDLLESMVKRFRGIKDSGRILPGHGGVLDRLDSLTAAAPVFALLWLLWGGA